MLRPDRDLESQGGESRLRVLLAGERLFAEEGIEATSLRKIAVAAKNGNNNAVQYYFKSRDGLIAEIFHHRIAQMEARRSRMLEEARRTGRIDDFRVLVEIFCLPLFDVVDSRGKHTYANFLLQYLSRYRTAEIGDLIEDVLERAPALAETMALMRAKIACPQPIAQTRILLGHLMFVTMLVRADHAPGLEFDSGEFRDLVEDTIGMIVVALLAPCNDAGTQPSTETGEPAAATAAALQQENMKLKLLVADLSLENLELRRRLDAEQSGPA